MADQVTKDPNFTKDEEFQKENERRKKSIEEFMKLPEQRIRAVIRCHLDSGVGPSIFPASGEILYVNKSWLIRPEDKWEHFSLTMSLSALSSGGAYGGVPAIPTKRQLEQTMEIHRKIQAIYRRGSDHLRASVARAADWACVPAVMLAAVLQNENSPNAAGWQRAGQALERGLQDLIGIGSTGFGNVKPETLKRVTQLFKTFYKTTVLRPGIKDVGQNETAEVDIYHAAAALREGLNKAWTAGPRSLNKKIFEKHTYYPYFGGNITKDVAIRAMGHYNGMGDDAKGYGERAMKRIQKETLYFHPPT